MGGPRQPRIQRSSLLSKSGPSTHSSGPHPLPHPLRVHHRRPRVQQPRGSASRPTVSKLPPPYYHLPSTHRLSVYEAPAHAHLLSPASYIFHPPPRAHEAGLVSSLSENSHLPPASWRVTVTVTPPTRLSPLALAHPPLQPCSRPAHHVSLVTRLNTSAEYPADILAYRTENAHSMR